MSNYMTLAYCVFRCMELSGVLALSTRGEFLICMPIPEPIKWEVCMPIVQWCTFNLSLWVGSQKVQSSQDYGELAKQANRRSARSPYRPLAAWSLAGFTSHALSVVIAGSQATLTIVCYHLLQNLRSI